MVVEKVSKLAFDRIKISEPLLLPKIIFGGAVEALDLAILGWLAGVNEVVNYVILGTGKVKSVQSWMRGVSTLLIASIIDLSHINSREIMNILQICSNSWISIRF